MTIDEPVRNDELLDATLAHIEAHPEDWNQDDWRTCFAGHAATLAGGQWLASAESYEPERVYLIPEDDDVDTHRNRVHVSRRARRVLGLTVGQAEQLFLAARTSGTLCRMIDEIRTGAL